MALGHDSLACSLALSTTATAHRMGCLQTRPSALLVEVAQLGPPLCMRVCAVLMYSYASHLRIASTNCAKVGGFASLLDPGRGGTKWRSLRSLTHHDGRCRCCCCRCVARGGLGVQAGTLSSEAAGCSSGSHAGGLLVRFTAPLMPQPPSRALKPPVPAMRGHCCP